MGMNINKENDKSRHQRRSLNLIANFTDGYAEDWHFAVGECFKDELDIKYTKRIEKSEKVMRWTQGHSFCFAEGHIIYDTPKAYLQWSEALKHIKLCCSVLRAVPNRPDNSGSVTFKLSKPNKNKDGLETIGQYNLTQNAFVEFLKTGNLNK